MKNLKQLTLDLCLKDRANFANFFVGKNGQLVDVLTGLCNEDSSPFIYFWGDSSVGKSHLAMALSQLFYEKDLSVAFLPLEDKNDLDPVLLDNLENFDLLCIDDIHLIAEDLEWEEGIFHSFNNLLDRGKKIVITANVAPHQLPLRILDLKSRMRGGLIFSLKELDDEEKVLSLKLRAKLRGLDLPENVAQFLLRHYERDVKSLFSMLEELDKAALMAKRRLTIPFVRSVMGSNGVRT